MKSIVSFLQHCRLGKKQVCSNLTVFPVLLPAVSEPYYLTLEQAIEQEVLVVTEVDAQGSVGRLRLRNHARQPILRSIAVGFWTSMLPALTVTLCPAKKLKVL